MKNVLVHGVGVAQRLLRAGLLDEIQIHLVPVLLGEGRRLFEHLGAEQRELETVAVTRGSYPSRFWAGTALPSAASWNWTRNGTRTLGCLPAAPRNRTCSCWRGRMSRSRSCSTSN